jgi:hypothetical protein
MNLMPAEQLMSLASAYSTLAAQTLAFSLVAWWTLHRRR